MEGALRHFKFELPGTALTKLEVDASMIQQPQVTLRRLLEEAGAGVGAVEEVPRQDGRRTGAP